MCGLTDLRMFVEIARANSMSIAAGRLGMSPASISGRLKSLEEHFGITLIRRTTRSLALTDEGRLLLHYADDLLNGFRALETELRGRKFHAEGAMVISAPPDFGRRWITPLAHEFAAANPDVDLHIQLETSAVAMGTRADVAFRIGLLPSSTMTTRKLADIGFVTCAAPSYLRGRGAPVRPAALKDHDCLLLASECGPDGGWSYVEEGRRAVVRVAGRQTASDVDVLVDLARLGHGVVHVHRWNVAQELADGSLVSLLDEYEPAPEPLHLLSDNRKLLPMRTVRFIDFVKEHFRRVEGVEKVGRGRTGSTGLREAASLCA